MPQTTKAFTLNDLPVHPPGKVGWPWTEQSKLVSDRMPDGSEYPRISIVTPSYNQGQFIEETIRSVLLQGYPNLEYIVIDGGSTDSTVATLRKYDEFISYWISEQDNGQTSAINKGLIRSTGSILGWINSDDLYVRSTLLKVAKAFHFQQICTLAHGNRILINENSQVTGWSPLPSFDPWKTSFNVCSETTFWQRQAMNEVGLLKEDLQFAMDLEFFGRLYLKGSFLKLNDYLGCFRCYETNKSSTIPHIGAKEANEEWMKLFSSAFPKSPHKSNYKLLLKDAIANPFLIAFPYLRYKLSKLLNS
jgi:glycosyltransferase involved in cell wall biosynthesis